MSLCYGPPECRDLSAPFGFSKNRFFHYLVWFGGAVGWVRFLLAALIMVLASKAAMEFLARDDLPRYAKQLSIATAFLACNLLSLVAFFAALPGDKLTGITRGFGTWLTLGGDGGGRLDGAWPWLLAVFVLVVTASIAFFSFDAVPHLDGVVYLFHARYFADGMISLPVPPVLEAFDHYLMDTNNDRWFSVNMPGWPAALVAGLMIGAPWLLVPILAAISVPLLHRFILNQTDLGTANLVTLLLAVSPWYLSMSSTFLLHTFVLVLVLGAWVLLQIARERPGIVLPFLAGCLMGWLFLTRPLEGVYMGILTGIWTLTFLRDRRHWRTVVAYGLGCLAVGGLLFLYNAAITGAPLTLPMTAYIDDFWGPGRNAIGFGPNIGAPGWGDVDVYDGHSPGEALINIQQSLYELNMDLFGWAAASVIFPLVYLLWGRWNRFTAAMAAIAGVTVVLYALYWYVGGFYAGPRYWFQLLVPMLVFAAFGIRRFIALLEPAFPEANIAGRVSVLVALLVVTGVVVFEGWMAFNKYPDIRGRHADYYALSKEDGLENALVFVRLEADPEYTSAFWLNDFDPEASKPIFARDLGPEARRQIAEAFPDRPIYIIEGRSSVNPRAKIVQGPLNIDDLD